jgi:hypothetical protein
MADSFRKQSIGDRKETRKAVCVVISDVHFRTDNLPLVTSAMSQALRKAEELNVPLIDCGDLLDSKAIIRAECANALIAVLSTAKVPVKLLVGNHTLVNEKGKEHALNFLRPYATVIDSPVWDIQLESWLLPYYSDNEELKKVLDTIPEGSRVICHQGVVGANMGTYVVDKSSLSADHFSNFRTISGHFHCRQDIKCGRPRKGAVGLFSYVGSPLTHSFGEANDPEKGFQILMDDGSLEFVPTNLRKHVVLEASIDDFHVKSNELPFSILSASARQTNEGDLLWLKVTGPRSELKKLNKEQIGKKLLGHSNYKLDLIDASIDEPETPRLNLSDSDLLDSIIDNMAETSDQKRRLKSLWKEILT